MAIGRPYLRKETCGKLAERKRVTVKYGVKVPGSNPGHNEVYWKLGKYWFVAPVLKTGPVKTR